MVLSLLREKFCVRDIASNKEPLVVLGNRLQIPLGPTGREPPLVIRCHSLHMTLRLLALFIRESEFTGLSEDAAAGYAWAEKWNDLRDGFEKKHSPDTWVTVYHKGKCLFHAGETHAFFDVIEHCQYGNREQYDYAVEMAQATFKKAGKSLLIEHESHVGYVQETIGDTIRLALVLRLPGQKATFTVLVQGAGDDELPPPDYKAMQIGADFIEAINRSVQAGFLQRKILDNKLSDTSQEGRQFKSLTKRIRELNNDIIRNENRYHVKYRPEKPDFKAIQDEAFHYISV